MERNLVVAVPTYEYFDKDLFERYRIGVEMQDLTDPGFEDEDIDEIVEIYREKLRGFKGIKSMHGPFIDLKPASPDRGIREASLRRYYKALEVAIDLDVDYIVFHSQINPNHIGEMIREINAKQNGEVWRKIMEDLKDFKGQVVIENVFEKEPSILRELLDEIGLDKVGLNLDIGHARLGDLQLEDWVLELKDHLRYSHVHSNDGNFDQHRPISREEVENYYRILDSHRLNPVLCLEYRFDFKEMEKELNKFR